MTTEEEKEKLESGRKTLMQRMATLAPFLPKPDMPVEEPARHWKSVSISPEIGKQQSQEIVHQF